MGPGVPTTVAVTEASQETGRIKVSLSAAQGTGPLRVELLGGPNGPVLLFTDNIGAGEKIYDHLDARLIDAAVPAGDYTGVRATWWSVQGEKAASIRVPCTPGLRPATSAPLYHTYGFSADGRWAGFKGTFVNAAEDWNQLVWQYTNQTAFTAVTGSNNPSLRFDLADGLFASQGDWGFRTGSDSLPVVLVDPSIFNFEPQFPKAIGLHELGHARGYADMTNLSCPVNDTIMRLGANPGGTYPSELGPGDNYATKRDVGAQ